MKTHKMNLITPTVIIICLLVFPVFQVFAQDSLFNKIDEIVQSEAKYDLFSGTILVAKKGKIIYEKSFGEADKERHLPNLLKTRFNISSIQKSFSSTMTMQLCQDGLISLEDPLSKYFPDCPFNTADQITIKNLLNHTSGLGDYRSHERYQEEADSYKDISDVLPLVYDIPPESNPNDKFSYSNTGYLLLKAIIEQVEEKKFAEVLQRRLFDPLNMNTAVMYHGGIIISNKADGHMLSGENKKYVKATGEPAAYSGGGIYLTVADMLKFDQALYTEHLLEEENKKIMFNPVEPSKYYGFGWIVVPFGGTTVIYHNGSSGGFNSEFRRYPEKGYTIIVLSNYDGGASDLANKIDCMLLKQPYLITTEAESYCRKGRMLRHRNQLKAALQYYLTALKLYKQGVVEKSMAKEIESGINMVGYAFLGRNDYNRAIEIFHMNAENYPESANAYDSLGEAYMKNGQKKLAIKNYEISLKLRPENENAIKMLRQLK